MKSTQNQDPFTSNQKNNSLVAKILVIGDGGVGKTALISRYIEDRFYQSYTATIGVDFRSKIVSIDDKSIKLQIWDTAGQERFKNITQAYYRGASGIILTFSLVDRASFQNIQKWMMQIDENSSKQCIKLLVGTKLDNESERTISRTEAQSLAMRVGIDYIQTSSKQDINIKQAFELLGRQIYKILLSKKPDTNQIANIKINSSEYKQNKVSNKCKC